MAQLVDKCLCLRLVAVAHRHRWRQQTYICSFLAERQPCFFFTCLNPPTAGSRQPPGALSPLLFFFVTLFTHISVEVYYGRAVYTQTCSIIFSVLCTILHCIFAIFMFLRSIKTPKQSRLLQHFELERESVQRGNKDGCFHL